MISRLFTPFSSVSSRNSQYVYQSSFKSSPSASRKGDTEISVSAFLRLRRDIY